MAGRVLRAIGGRRSASSAPDLTGAWRADAGGRIATHLAQTSIALPEDVATKGLDEIRAAVDREIRFRRCGSRSTARSVRYASRGRSPTTVATRPTEIAASVVHQIACTSISPGRATA